VHHKGSTQRLLGGVGGFERVTLGDDVNFTWETELAVDGRKMLHGFSGMRPSYDAKGDSNLAQQVYRSSYDGKEQRSFGQYPNTSKKTQGYIWQVNKSSGVSMALNQLLLSTYCTFDPAMAGFDWRELKVLEQQAEVEGRKCFVLQKQYLKTHQGAKNAPTSSWWIDPGRDHSIVRFVYSNRPGSIHMQIDVAHKQDAKHGWVPIQWTIRRFRAEGKLNSTVVAEVTDYEINPVLDDDVFKISFPSGTHMN
jgi:hypothetical protein